MLFDWVLDRVEGMVRTVVSSFETAFWPRLSRRVTVPDLCGLLVDDARIAALRAGVKLHLQRLTPDPAPAVGLVVRQDPPPGSHVLRDSPVTAWLIHPARKPRPGD